MAHTSAHNRALAKQRQEDQKFTASLSYTVRGQPGLLKTLSQITQKRQGEER